MTRSASEPKPVGKAAPEVQEGNVAFQTEEDAAFGFASDALRRVTSKLDDASGDLKEIVRAVKPAGGDSRQLHDAEEALAQIQPIEDFLVRHPANSATRPGAEANQPTNRSVGKLVGRS